MFRKKSNVQFLHIAKFEKPVKRKKGAMLPFVTTIAFTG